MTCHAFIRTDVYIKQIVKAMLLQCKCFFFCILFKHFFLNAFNTFISIMKNKIV